MEIVEKKNKKSRGKIVKDFFDKRSTKYGTNTILLIIAVLGIVVLINYIAQKEVYRIDVTKNKKYSLSDQTEKVLNKLNEDVQVIAFYTDNSPERQTLRDLIKEYSAKNSRIKLEFVDPEKNPGEANRNQVSRYNTIILKKGEKKEEITSATESDLTSGILRLIKDETKIVYFLTGHGEKETLGTDEKKSYNLIKTELEKQIYQVNSLSLITDQKVPDDASIVVIAGPTIALDDREKEALKTYINDRKGKVMFMLDPLAETGNDLKMGEFLKEFGLNYNHGIVIDPKANFWGDVATPLVTDFTSHQITEGQKVAFFAGSAEASRAESVSEKWSVTELGRTSGSAWLETNTVEKAVKFDDGSDKKGPISILAVAQEADPAGLKNEENKDQNKEKARVVLIGDSDFALDIFLSTDQGQFNRDLFVNIINWLEAEEDLISILPKEESTKEVTLTGNQQKIIFYGTVIGMPVIVGIAGIVVFIKRKKKKAK